MPAALSTGVRRRRRASRGRGARPSSSPSAQQAPMRAHRAVLLPRCLARVQQEPAAHQLRHRRRLALPRAWPAAQSGERVDGRQDPAPFSSPQAARAVGHASCTEGCALRAWRTAKPPRVPMRAHCSGALWSSTPAIGAAAPRISLSDTALLPERPASTALLGSAPRNAPSHDLLSCPVPLKGSAQHPAAPSRNLGASLARAAQAAQASPSSSRQRRGACSGKCVYGRCRPRKKAGRRRIAAAPLRSLLVPADAAVQHWRQSSKPERLGCSC
jgi:hypothetical protein